MTPFWIRILTGFARVVIPEIWEAIQAGDAKKAARLAELAAQRQAEHLAAKELLDGPSAHRKVK